jgi:putative endonuclease
MTSNEKLALGKEGELAAYNLLTSLGFTVREVNWRFKKYEIDIIATNKEWIVFVEVKSRSVKNIVAPEFTVSIGQQRRIIAAAHHYLVENNIQLEARFDIISILEDTNGLTVKHLPGAFRPLAR